MPTDVKLAAAALKASGLSGCATLSLLFPFGRERRVQGLLRKRHSVIEAKNTILDALARVQKPLEPLCLHTLARAKEALADSDKRRLVLGLGLSRAVLEDEARKWGTELGPSFEQALGELVSAGRVLKLTGPSGDDVYLIVARFARQRYDLAALSRLLHRGKDYGTLLRAREQHETDTDIARTYRMK